MLMRSHGRLGLRGFKARELIGQGPELARRAGLSRVAARLGIARGRIGWLVLALLLLPVPVVAIVVRHDAGTAAAALLFVLGIVLSMWMLPERGERPAAADPADPAAMLEAEIAEARLGLRHADAWMRLFPLGILSAALLKLSAFSEAGLHHFFPRLLGKAQRGESTLLAVLVLLFVLLYFVRRSLYFRARLRRLTTLRGMGGQGTRLQP